MPSREKSRAEKDDKRIRLKRENLGLVHPEDTAVLEKEFRDLVKRWRKDTEFKSSITESAMHPAYQRIIGMGSCCRSAPIEGIGAGSRSLVLGLMRDYR